MSIRAITATYELELSCGHRLSATVTHTAKQLIGLMLETKLHFVGDAAYVHINQALRDHVCAEAPAP